jgi:hypothetical protein
MHNFASTRDLPWEHIATGADGLAIAADPTGT